MKQLRYAVEEKHRGEWIPLISTDEKGNKLGQKIVKITEEVAETMNIDAEKVRIRYVLESKISDNVDPSKMNKSEQEALAVELGIEFNDSHTNQATRGAFLKEAIEAKK